MVALVLVLTFVVLLLGVLVAGLLRSHADILKALHDLGAGVGDPSATGVDEHGHQGGVDHAARPVAVPFRLGPPLPGERDSVSAPTISGVTPGWRRVGHVAHGPRHAHPRCILVLGLHDLRRILGGVAEAARARPP